MMNVERENLEDEYKHLMGLINRHKNNQQRIPKFGSTCHTSPPIKTLKSTASNKNPYKIQKSSVSSKSSINNSLKLQIAQLETAIKVHKSKNNNCLKSSQSPISSKNISSSNKNSHYKSHKVTVRNNVYSKSNISLGTSLKPTRKLTYNHHFSKATNKSYSRFKKVSPLKKTISLITPTSKKSYARNYFSPKHTRTSNVYNRMYKDPGISSYQWRKNHLRGIKNLMKSDTKTSANYSAVNTPSKFISIGGFMYRSSSSKLQKAELGTKITRKYKIIRASKNSKINILNVRGVKFSMDPTNKQLVQVENSKCRKSNISRVDFGGETYVQKRPGLLVKTGSSKTKHFVNRAVNRSIFRVHQAKTKKTNKSRFCLFYNRYGKCNKGEKCKFIHDPDKVAVCTRFLRGTCKVLNCPFSHQVSKEKMPVCSYFLKGKCTLDDCPYMHVNVNPKAEPCKDFLSGFCPSGSKCRMLHSLICPTYSAIGNCQKGSSCPMKHKKKIVKSKKPRISTDSSSISEKNSSSFISLPKTPRNDASIKSEDCLKIHPSFFNSSESSTPQD